jgi:hypothetical protein
MGITLFTDGDRRYYRVTKAWNGKEHQVYVRVGKNEEKALKEAKKVEEDLEVRRKAYIQKKKLSGEDIFHEDGRIVGLQLQVRHREGRKPCTEFKIRVKEPDQKAQFKSVSVNAHGVEEAFESAVEKICEMRDLNKGGDVHKKMLETKSRYLEDAKLLAGILVENVNSSPEIPGQKKDKSFGIFDTLKSSMQDFLKKQSGQAKKK